MSPSSSQCHTQHKVNDTLATEEEQDRTSSIRYQGDAILLNDRLAEVEREQAESKKRDNEYKNQQLELNRRTANLTLWLVVCTAFLGGVGLYQAYVSGLSADAAQSAANAAAANSRTGKLTLKEIQKSSADTHALAVAAGSQATAAQTQASAAKSASDTASASLGNSQKSFRLEERPYLWAQPRGAARQPDDTYGVLRTEDNGETYHVAIAVDIRNSGRSPAVDVVTTKMDYRIGPTKEAVQKARSFVPTYGLGGEGYQVIPNAGITPEGDILTISKEEGAHIQNGSWTVFVVGAVQYTDMFSPKIKPYETTYCFGFKPTGMMFGTCPFGNSIK